jgi:hypothetical protein
LFAAGARIIAAHYAVIKLFIHRIIHAGWLFCKVVFVFIIIETRGWLEGVRRQRVKKSMLIRRHRLLSL